MDFSHKVLKHIIIDVEAIMKYVIINEDTPIIFPEHIDHSKFSSVGRITSAGFCAFDKDKLGTWLQVYGESISLKLKPAEDDKIWLNMLLDSDGRDT